MFQSRLQRQVLACCLAVGALAGVSRGVDDNDPQDQWSIIHCGMLLAVPGKAPHSNVSIIVKNGRIVEVRSGFIGADALTEAGEAKVGTIDLRDSFVMPGLIDCHTHITGKYTADIRL
ncbi:MAG: hypothetical protein IIB99_13345, partial [Planctomycetes bacterium]|nr:hypothetical protein [Planctomycetota bacterium]